jgi:solute carrier family 25, member 44
MAAECASALFYVPTENVSQRLQLQSIKATGQRFTNISEIVRMTLRYEGWLGLYRGYCASIYTYAPGSAIWWASYELSKKPIRGALHRYSSLENNHPSTNHLVHIIGGAFSGLTSCLVTNPLDVIKTRFQTLDLSLSENRILLRNGVRSMLFSMFWNEGLRGLYRGLSARLMVSVPGSACSFSVYEIVKRYSLRQPTPHPSSTPITHLPATAMGN